MLRILIPNYAEYQHYRDRNPPWIKLHKKILTDYKFMNLSGNEQMLCICLWLLASENPLEEGMGVVNLEGPEELHWRLRPREGTVSLGGSDTLKALKSKGFLEFNEGDLSPEQDASTVLARRNTEGEGERERYTTTEQTPAPSARGGKKAKSPSKKSWAREAAEDWDAHFGKGSSAPGRIGAALTRLVKAHGWDEVRPVWQRYIAEKDPTYASPQDFATKYQVWVDGSVHVGGESIEAHNRTQTQRFLDGEKPLPSQRGLSRILPPGKT